MSTYVISTWLAIYFKTYLYSGDSFDLNHIILFYILAQIYIFYNLKRQISLGVNAQMWLSELFPINI